MRIELIIEYVRELPWSPSRWAIHICRGLVERGHRVSVLCDGADDSREFAGSADVLVRRPLRTVRGRDPRGFARWVKKQPRSGVRLSLSRFVAGDVWLPIGPSARVDARRLLIGGNPASIVMDALHEPWIPAAIAQERRAAAEGAQSLRLEIGDARIGFASGLEAAAPTEIRRRVREQLGVGPDQFAMIASAVHLDRAGTQEMVAGLAQRAQAGERLIVLFAGRDAWSVSRLGFESGIADLVRPIGSTAHMKSLLVASDVVIAPGDGEEGATGRWIADAVRMGKPVLCSQSAPGAALVSGSRGLVVTERSSTAWDRAFALARTLGSTSRDLGEVSMPAFVSRLEQVLTEFAA